MFSTLGSGVGLRSAHYAPFLAGSVSSAAWVEVVTENFLTREGHRPARPFQILSRVRCNYPVVLHGVSLSLASADPTSPSYLRRLRELADAIQPVWISDHLCWTGVDGENLHDLYPVPYNEEVLAWVTDKICRVQDALGRRILIENVSAYTDFTTSAMPEWEFVAEVARRADCGILLDVNNVYVSSVNQNFNALTYLEALPVERVGQMHLAGHSVKKGYLFDTHDAPVCDQVWALYARAVKRFGAVSSMIERDDKIPDWEELEQEVLKMGRIRDEAAQQAAPRARRLAATL